MKTPAIATLARAFALAAALLATPAASASLVVKALQRDGAPLAGAVVTAEAVTPVLAPAAPIEAVMDQQDLVFVPDLLVVPVNSTVQFPNSDAVSHQVYSFSSVRQFQLPLYRGRAHPPVTFAKPGIVTLGCNIHDNMLAYIVVTTAQRYGRTSAAGEWLGSNVAAGRYRVRVWHPLLNESQELERMVEVGGEGDAVSLTLTLTRNLKPAPLGRQPHSWAY